MDKRLRKSMKPRAIKVWNDTRSISKVADACGCSDLEARVFLSTQRGYPDFISLHKSRKVKLTTVQLERPEVPVTLVSVSFLDPARRLPGEGA